MGVYTYVCRKSGGEWKGKQRGEEEKEAIEASAETTYDLQRKLVHSSLSKDISSAGFVSSSFSLVTPSSAVFQVIIGGASGGGFIGGGAAPAASSGGSGAAAEAPAAETKVEEKDESDDDLGFSLFD